MPEFSEVTTHRGGRTGKTLQQSICELAHVSYSMQVRSLEIQSCAVQSVVDRKKTEQYVFCSAKISRVQYLGIPATAQSLLDD